MVVLSYPFVSSPFCLLKETAIMVLAMRGLKAVVVLSGCVLMCESNKECTPEEQSAEAALYTGLNGQIDAYKASLSQQDIINYGVCGNYQKSECGGALCDTVDEINGFLGGIPPEGCEICKSYAQEFVIRQQTIDAMNVYDCDPFTWAEELEAGPPPPKPWYDAYAKEGGKCAGGEISPSCGATCGAVNPPLSTCESVEDQMFEGGCLGTCSAEEALAAVQSRFPQCEFSPDAIGPILGQPKPCSWDCQYIQEPETCAEVEDEMYAGGCLSTCTVEEALTVGQNFPGECNFTPEGIQSILGQPNPNPPGREDDDDGSIGSTSKDALIGAIVGGGVGFFLIAGVVYMVMKNRADNYGAKKPGKEISDDRL